MGYSDTRASLQVPEANATGSPGRGQQRPPQGPSGAEKAIEADIDGLTRELAQIASLRQQKLTQLKGLRSALRSLRQTREPALSDVIRPIVAELLRDNGSMEFDALYEFVKDRLDGERPANGVKQVVQRLLKEPGVREEAPGVYVASGV